MKTLEKLLKLSADLTEQHDYRGAIRLLEEAIAQNSLAPRAYNDIGVIYYLLGDFKVALDYLSRAVELDQTNLLFVENLIAAVKRTQTDLAADPRLTVTSQTSKPPTFDPARHIDLDQWLASPSIGIYQHAQALSDQQWYKVLCDSVTGQRFQNLTLPYFIDQDRQRNFVGSFGVPALTEAFNFVQILHRYLDSNKTLLDTDTRILDFGCGWGHYTRFMLRYARPDNIFGFDVDSGMIECCKKTFGCCNFITVGPFPPSPVRDQLFELVLAYSVFSHLSPAAANAWIQEFARITRPGGMVFLTTQGRTFIDFCRQIRESGNFEHGWHYNLAKSFVNVEQAKQDYDAGNFLYAPTGGGDSREASFYGEAIIPRDYIERYWTEHFELVDFIDNRSILPQALIVLKRRPEKNLATIALIDTKTKISTANSMSLQSSLENEQSISICFERLKYLDSFIKQDFYEKITLITAPNQKQEESYPYNEKPGTLSKCGDVIVGHEGWLYLLSGNNLWIDHYIGKIRLEYKQIQERANLLFDREQKLNEIGVAYCHLIVPEKICVHPEFFPLQLSILDTRAAIQLSEANIPSFLYPLEELQKYQGFIPLWIKGNSHWNIYGCFIVYCEILKKLKIDFEPNFEYLMTGVKMVIHDLVVKFSNYHERSRYFKTPAIEVYNNNLWDTIRQHQGNHYILRNSSAFIDEKICIFGDSYAFDAGLSYLFSNHFKEVHFIWERNINYEYCQKIGARYVLTEITERLAML